MILPEASMKYMLVRHRVADLDTWKKVFDSHTEGQKEAADVSGVLDQPDCWYLD